MVVHSLLLVSNIIVLLIGNQCKTITDLVSTSSGAVRAGGGLDTVTPVSSPRSPERGWSEPHSPWVGSATPIGPPADAVPGLRDLLYAAVVTGVWSGLLSLVVYGIGVLFGVPFEVATPGAGGLIMVPWFAIALVPLLAALVGALLAGLALGHRHARRVVFWVGTAIAIASCAGPLAQPDDVLWSTRIWLLIPHVITWFLVVPQIARIVGDSEPGMFEPRMSTE